MCYWVVVIDTFQNAAMSVVVMRQRPIASRSVPMVFFMGEL